jgi:hypothetical protein
MSKTHEARQFVDNFAGGLSEEGLRTAVFLRQALEKLEVHLNPGDTIPQKTVTEAFRAIGWRSPIFQAMCTLAIKCCFWLFKSRV